MLSSEGKFSNHKLTSEIIASLEVRNSFEIGDPSSPASAVEVGLPSKSAHGYLTISADFEGAVNLILPFRKPISIRNSPSVLWFKMRSSGFPAMVYKGIRQIASCPFAYVNSEEDTKSAPHHLHRENQTKSDFVRISSKLGVGSKRGTNRILTSEQMRSSFDHAKASFDDTVVLPSDIYGDITDSQHPIIAMGESGIVLLCADIQPGDILFSFLDCDVVAILRLIGNGGSYLQCSLVGSAIRIWRIQQTWMEMHIAPSSELSSTFVLCSG
jgi:hypothetical protein